MDNKGQSLIFFVLVLPIIALFMVLLIDVCSYEVQSNHIKNSIKDNIKVVVNSDIKDEERIKNIIKENIDNSEVEVIMSDTSVEINVTYKHKSFSKKLISNEPTVNYHYCGNYENKEIKNKKCN